MNKLTIFFLIILSNLVTNVQAAEEAYQTPAERRKIRMKEMRESVKYVQTEYVRVSRIENLPNKLTALKNLENKADDAENFLKRYKMYGLRGLDTVRRIQKRIGEAIKEMSESVMDIDTEEMDIGDSD